MREEQLTRSSDFLGEERCVPSTEGRGQRPGTSSTAEARGPRPCSRRCWPTAGLFRSQRHPQTPLFENVRYSVFARLPSPGESFPISAALDRRFPPTPAAPYFSPTGLLQARQSLLPSRDKRPRLQEGRRARAGEGLRHQQGPWGQPWLRPSDQLHQDLHRLSPGLRLSRSAFST